MSPAIGPVPAIYVRQRTRTNGADARHGNGRSHAGRPARGWVARLVSHLRHHLGRKMLKAPHSHLTAPARQPSVSELT